MKTTPSFATFGTSVTPILDSFELSYKEALDYLGHVLGIASARTRIRRDRLGLLQEIIEKTHYVQPFQVITNYYGIHPSERHIPTFDEIKLSMFSRQGGVCYELNAFLNRLLHVLGYHVTLIAGQFMGFDRYHVSNVVHDETSSGKLYLAEVGACDPTLRPVPFDFDDESPIYTDSYLTYKFKRARDGEIIRLHKPIKGSMDEEMYGERSWHGSWRVNTKLDVRNPRDVDYFAEQMSYVFGALPRPKLRILSDIVFALICGSRNQVSLIHSNSCSIRKEDGVIEHHVFSSPDELLDAYRRHFPTIPQNKVENAITNGKIKFS
ncbi:uncharacterized protein [Diadema antillarum]|uniref:uncharacterized protein n=1 Tax=Diadema antillarum TaxID=105358 RepID=UPI003A899326